MFFKKNKSKEKTLSFSNVKNMSLSTKGMGFELIPKDHIIKYRNVISPRDGGMSFPDGYFEEKSAKISKNDIELIAKEFDRMFKTRTPKNECPVPPLGATLDPFMGISLRGKKTVYYSNRYPTEDGFMAEIEKVPPEFEHIVQILMQYCTFPVYFEEAKPLKLDPDVLSKVNADLESNDVIHLTGYRFEANGVYGYDFYKSADKICSVSRSDARLAPVTVQGNSIRWISDFDNFITICPGLTRSINDESTGKEVFKIVYEAQGKYRITEAVSVYCSDDKYTFYSDQSVIAKINRINEKNDHTSEPLAQNAGCEPYFEIDFCNEVENELLMIMLAFPMLKFGL